METNSIKLNTGDILHCHGYDINSRITRAFTKHWCDHSALVVEAWGQVFVLDVINNVLSVQLLDHWLKSTNYDVLVARPKEPISNEMLFCIRAFNRTHQPMLSFVKMWFKKPLDFFKKKKAKSKHLGLKERTTIPSEFVAEMFNIKKPYLITPPKLYKLTEDKNFKIFAYRLKYIL